MMRKNLWADLLDNTVIVLVLAVLLLVPVAFGARFLPADYPILGYGGLALMLLVVWGLKAQGALSWEKARTFITSGPNAAILAFVAWSAASLSYSVAPVRTQAAVLQLGFGALIYFLIVYQFRRPAQVRTLLAGLVTLGIALVFGAFLLDAEHHWRDLAGTFQDRQLFGAFLGIVLPVLLGVASGSSNRRLKIAAQVSALLVGAALLLTECRSSWLGVLVALAVFAALGIRHIWTLRQLSTRKHELLVTPILAIAVLALFLGASRLSDSVRSRAATLQTVTQDASVTDRFNLWTVAGQVFAARPLTGWGAGAYAIAQVPFNAESRSVAAIENTGASLGENPHNSYLTLAAELGGIGLSLHILMLGLFFLTGLRALPRMDKGLRQTVLIGALAAIAGQAVDSFANPGWSFPQVSLFLWVVLGIGMRGAGLGDAVQSTVPQAEGRVLGIPPGMVQPLRIALVTGMAVVLGAQLFNVNLINPAQAKSSPKPPKPPSAQNRPCYPSQGYWKNHPENWPVNSLTLGDEPYTKPQLLSLWNMAPKGDASLILAHQLMAAKLTIAGMTPAEQLSPAPQAMIYWIGQADAILAPYVGQLPYGVKSSSTQGSQMINIAAQLESYNTLPGNCSQ